MPAAPDDLPTRIRIAVAKAREESGLPAMSRRLRDRAHLILANILQPLALPATGGLVVALLVFTLVLPFYARVVRSRPVRTICPPRFSSRRGWRPWRASRLHWRIQPLMARRRF